MNAAPSRRLRGAWNRYWFREAPLLDLGVLRLLAVGYHLGWMLVGPWSARLARAVASDGGDYDPVLVVRIASGGARPSPPLVEGLGAIALLAGLLALVGLATRTSLWVFAACVVYLQGYAYSFGAYHHAEAALAVLLVALAASPAGGALSLDRLLATRRAGGARPPATSPFARWPLLLARWMLALVFLSAAASKLAHAGLEWTNGYTLQYCAFAKGAQLRTPIGVWLSERHELCRALSWTVLLFESSFVLVLIRPVLAWIYVPLGAAIVVGIELAIGASFHQLLVLLGACVPWHRLFAAAGGGLRH